MTVAFAPLIGRQIHNALKSPSEMELVGIADLAGNICDCQVGGTQIFAGFVDAVGDQEFLGAFAGHFFEKLAEVAAVEAQMLGNIFNGDIFHIMVFYVIGSGLNIEFFDVIGRHGSGGGGMLYQAPEKKISIAHGLGGKQVRVF